MPTTSQMLLDYPDILLQVLAELRNAFLDTANSREQVIELLAAQITDPTSVQMAFEEAVDYFPDSKVAVETLLREGGEMAEAQFSRQFGGIRQMGPAKLERETPWEYPESAAELLYYYGLIGRTFKGAGQKAHTVIYIPSDVAPWLPHPQGAGAESGLPVRPTPPPPPARALLADDSFLEDAGTLLGFLHTEQLRLTPAGPHPEDIDRFVQRLQMPFSEDVPDLNVRLALLLHLANRLGWLRRGDDGCVHLTNNRVRQFLEKTRAEQRQALWDAWRQSPDWNDLCRTPGLECAETGNWKNDPFQTRTAVLQLLAKLQPGAWYAQSDVVQAIQKVEPDFQRPTGNYDTWYIRSSTTQEFLRGFEQWDAVEGALLRFLIRGPLHWLSAMDLAEPSAGDDLQLSLSRWGSLWLGHDTPQPHEKPHDPMTVGDDFTVTVPLGTPLSDRFRVERFAAWQASYPHFVYQINQRSLKRAADEGIGADRVLAFLQARTRGIPARVRGALERLAGERVREGQP
ncbi:MAG TPA: hypothetical protein VNK95_00705 [Caldilineaceae bacterium]|nr:hypothetical protein [Caldilineaceae bacterium]